jgi:hypothetical protein
MSRRKKHDNKKTTDQHKPITIHHHADRRCVVGQPIPKKTNYRPTAR